MTPLLIFLGGGLGSLARYGLSTGIQTLAQKTALHRFPLGILTCNLLGCFLIGCLFGYFTNKTSPPWVFPLLATGFLGGFTTFSTFAKDTHSLWTTGLTHLALLKIALSVILGLAAVFLGIKLTHPS
ncbi:MAG: CrcB protein [Akkermansiaceae bacterium]|jgi:CrcB protein